MTKADPVEPLPVFLEKLETLPNAVVSMNPPRTQSMAGHTYDLPTVGCTFSIVGAPIDPECAFRVWTTSLIKNVIEKGPQEDCLRLIEFTTENSLYRLRVCPNGSYG